MKVQRYPGDEMTPMERQKAAREGRETDRIPCVPFMGMLKAKLAGIPFREYATQPSAMAEGEIFVYENFGCDRAWIGPNTRGLTEALGGVFTYPPDGTPYLEKRHIDTYDQLDHMEPVDARRDQKIRSFLQAAEILTDRGLTQLVPTEMSIGGPFTIASNLRGAEMLLRDCRRSPQQVHRLLRLVTDSEKSCIDAAGDYGLGIAMADPVASPGLIGPKMYQEFVYPYTKELTEYAQSKIKKKVSLHMCGKTYSIWKYFRQYPLNEISLDNIIQMDRAVQELGDVIPLAGNVDPVETILHGTKEEITRAVHSCIQKGLPAKAGYTLASGCDIPERASAHQIQWFMEAARNYPACHA
ncbi:MAG: uroporphyrinogen decarboxylase family protein [Eubacteriales bacterium]|nr:uroporphyrinogen decarboxylase family protein [Eubacteriales bacterium]